MKIDWSFVAIIICGIAATACTWCADLFLDDMQMYVDIKIGSAYFLIVMIFVLFNSFNNKRRREIQDLHLGIEEVMAINDELRREIADLKKEVEELRNSIVQ